MKGKNENLPTLNGEPVVVILIVIFFDNSFHPSLVQTLMVPLNPEFIHVWFVDSSNVFNNSLISF